MPHIHATASAVIDASPQTLYEVLADYRQGHPQIVPKRFFSNLEVESGGIGAGTRIRFQMRTLGVTRTCHAEITEPEPGRVLVETDLDLGAVTTFTVEPVEDGKRASVTITTEWDTPGFQGLMQRLLAPNLLRGIYAEELHNLERHVNSE